MAFILRGWRPHIKKKPWAFELMLPQGMFLSYFSFGWISNLERIFPLRKHWQCGLSAVLDENLHYSFPATWQVDSQHPNRTWTRRSSPLPTAMLVWYGEQPLGVTPLAILQCSGANPAPTDGNVDIWDLINHKLVSGHLWLLSAL